MEVSAFSEFFLFSFLFDSLALDMDLKPLELKLAALVLLKVNLAFTTVQKELFKANLWHYETPTISKRIISLGKDAPDTSPPNFANFEANNVRFHLSLLLHLHAFVEGSYFHCTLSVCLSVCVSVWLCL